LLEMTLERRDKEIAQLRSSSKEKDLRIQQKDLRIQELEALVAGFPEAIGRALDEQLLQVSSRVAAAHEDLCAGLTSDMKRRRTSR